MARQARLVLSLATFAFSVALAGCSGDQPARTPSSAGSTLSTTAPASPTAAPSLSQADAVAELQSYLNAWSTGTFHSPDSVDYTNMIQEFSLDDRVLSGEIDEVVAWGAPYFGYWESQMVGAGAYWCNSPGLVRVGTPKYVMMGLNYERGVAEAIHSFGHRAESILTHVYGSWNSGTTVLHLWDKFTKYNLEAPGMAACGNVHFPPNGVADYDYANTKTAPGHATIGTGAYTDGHGIDSNEWWDLTRSTTSQVSAKKAECPRLSRRSWTRLTSSPSGVRSSSPTSRNTCGVPIGSLSPFSSLPTSSRLTGG